MTTAETLTHLSDGDEYLDLTQLDRGMQQASGKTTPMNRVLPKKAVLKDTWDKIPKQLPAAGTKALSATGGKQPQAPSQS